MASPLARDEFIFSKLVRAFHQPTMASPTQADALNKFKFDNTFTRELPGDGETANYPRQVRDALWSRSPTKPLVSPELMAYVAYMCFVRQKIKIFRGSSLVISQTQQLLNNR
jgi:hypothetical protein